MKRLGAFVVIGLLFGLIISAFPVDGKSKAHPPGLVDFVTDLIGDVLGLHHQELEFSVEPGESFSFPLPKTQSPVRIDVSFSLLNGGTQTPSEIMCAVVNQDPISGEMTWLGTNNDGTQEGSNSVGGSDLTIAHIFGGASPTINATMEVDDLELGTLKISQDADHTILPGSYIVHLWF